MSQLISLNAAMKTRLSARRLGVAALVAVLTIALPGCGSSQPSSDETNTDARRLRSLVGDLIDNSDDLPTLGAKFSRAAPPNAALLAKVRQYSLSLVEPIEVNGNLATFRVRVRQGQQERGEVKWTAVKEAGGWKLRATPLP